jgi:hypothetical protein
MGLAVVSNTTPSPQHRPTPDLRATVEDLRRRHRRADPDEIAQFLFTTLREDDDLLLEACRFVASKTLMAIAAQQRRQQAAPSGRERIARKAVERQEVQAIAAKVKEQVVLDMTITLINGEQKKLRFTTGSELAKLGSAYSRLAERVGADCLVGEVLTEAEAAALLKVE